MATLVFERSDGDQESVLLSASRTTVLGRQRECDVVLAHPSISRRHAIIRPEDAGFVIEDQSTG